MFPWCVCVYLSHVHTCAHMHTPICVCVRTHTHMPWFTPCPSQELRASGAGDSWHLGQPEAELQLQTRQGGSHLPLGCYLLIPFVVEQDKHIILTKCDFLGFWYKVNRRD